MSTFTSIFENLWCEIMRAIHWLLDLLLPIPRGTWRPDRRPVRVIQMYNGSEEHPWGLNRLWVGRGVPWLLETMQAAYDENGFRRFMWSLPAGRLNETCVPWPSAQWQVLDDCSIYTVSDSVRQDLADIISPWLAKNPDVQVIIYLGGVIKSAYDRDTHGAWVPDPWCPRDRRIMYLNFDGFAALAPRRKQSQIGFWFDNASIPEKRRKEYRVVEWLRAQSLWGGMEPVAHDNRIRSDPHTNEPNASYVGKVAMFGLRQFFDPTVDEEPVRNASIIRDVRATWRFDPTTSEIGFFLHQYPIDTLRPENTPHGLTQEQGEAMLRNYHERGFILGSYGERWEDAIKRIISGG